MEVHFRPDLERSCTTSPSSVAGFVDELAAMRGMIESRYDDLKSGRVKPIDGEQAFTRLREKSQNCRT
jgi:hypothetical protein